MAEIFDPKYVVDIYKGFAITRCDDALRVACISDPKRHTHLHSLKACYKVINDMLSEKIPLKRSTYYLISLARLSANPVYIDKINAIVEVRKQKGKKLAYVNQNNGVKK